MSGDGQFVTIARVRKTQGRAGEVLAELLTDFPERFDDRKRLYLLDERNQRRELELEDHWFHKGAVVLKFAGIGGINDAEQLLRAEVQIRYEDRTPLEEGAVYVSDLVGCEIFEISGPQPRRVGLVQDVNFSAGEAPLLEVKGDREYLIPYAGSYLRKLDLAARRIELALPEGMLELDAPLSQNERERQKKEAEEARAQGEKKHR